MAQRSGLLSAIMAADCSTEAVSDESEARPYAVHRWGRVDHRRSRRVARGTARRVLVHPGEPHARTRLRMSVNPGGGSTPITPREKVEGTDQHFPRDFLRGEERRPRAFRPDGLLSGPVSPSRGRAPLSRRQLGRLPTRGPR
jgi:hypothetical protein